MIILFDLDGVVIDTEPQYKIFWDRIGLEYLGDDDFQIKVKGQTLKQIMEHFECVHDEHNEIIEQLDEFERNMSYDYVPGVDVFMKEMKARGVPMAIVTSSNETKMSNVRRAHPELWELVDAVLTSEHFSRSKPDPECFLKGMEMLGGSPEDTYVFEDSIHGVNAGLSSGAHVIGLATTLPRTALEPLCETVLDDFVDFSL